MVASAKVAYYARRQAECGVKSTGNVSADMSVVQKRKRDVVSSFRGGSESRLQKAAKPVKLTTKPDGGEKEMLCSHAPATAGRVPSTNDLGLEKTSVQLDKSGHVLVNEKHETSAERVYALSDIKGGPALTQISYDDFRILKNNLLTIAPTKTTTNRLIPYTVFIDPQLSHVGLTETEAKQQGKKVRVGKMPMAWVARALEMDESRGFIKVLVDGGTDQIVGAAILGG